MLKIKFEEYKKKNKLTNYQIWKITGIGQNTLSLIGKGRITDIRVSSLCKLANVFDVSLDELVDRNDYKLQ